MVPQITKKINFQHNKIQIKNKRFLKKVIQIQALEKFEIRKKEFGENLFRKRI